MTRLLLTITAALLLAVPAAAARKPHTAAPTSFAVTLTVTGPGSYHADRTAGPLTILYVLTHRCFVADAAAPGGISYVEIDYQALPWYTDADVSADLGPFAVAGEQCEAFVWAWPDSTTAVSNTVTTGG